MTRPDKKIDRNRHSQATPNSRGVSVSIRSVMPVLMYLRARGPDVNAFLARRDFHMRRQFDCGRQPASLRTTQTWGYTLRRRSGRVNSER
jgi:hypothetical protein